jgi:hypothetical protein
VTVTSRRPRFVGGGNFNLTLCQAAAMAARSRSAFRGECDEGEGSSSEGIGGTGPRSRRRRTLGKAAVIGQRSSETLEHPRHRRRRDTARGQQPTAKGIGGLFRVGAVDCGWRSSKMAANEQVRELVRDDSGELGVIQQSDERRSDSNLALPPRPRSKAVPVA